MEHLYHLDMSRFLAYMIHRKPSAYLEANLKNHLVKGLILCVCLLRCSLRVVLGINDDLNGVERPVSFDIPNANKEGQVVHSLAKWKRLALYRYGFRPGKGLFTDMNAIRRDELMDNTHSIYVDQWDWEKVITREERTVDYLKKTVNDIVTAIADTDEAVKTVFPCITTEINRNVSFVTSQELEDKYPSLSPREREDAYLKQSSAAYNADR